MENRENTMIMFLCSYQAPYGGNFVPSLMALEDALVLHNYNVVYVFPNEAKKRYWFQQLKVLGKKIETINFSDSKLRVLKTLCMLEQKYQTAIVHSHFVSPLVMEIFALVNPRTKVFLHVHSDFSAGKTNLKHRFRQACIYKAFAQRVRFLSVSPAFVKANPGKVMWVPNALAKNRIACVHTDGMEIRKKHGIHKDETFVEIFGWSPVVKGVDIAVNAVKLLSEKQDCKIKLGIVCGREMTQQKMRQWVKTNTVCTGEEKFLIYLEPVEDVFSYHEAADILCSASRSEGFSYAILEMLSRGKRCVISDIPGISWAKEYQTVYPFESEDINSCAQALQNAIEEGKVYSQEVETSIALTFSIDKWTEMILKAFGIEV